MADDTPLYSMNWTAAYSGTPTQVPMVTDVSIEEPEGTRVEIGYDNCYFPKLIRSRPAGIVNFTFTCYSVEEALRLRNAAQPMDDLVLTEHDALDPQADCGASTNTRTWLFSQAWITGITRAGTWDNPNTTVVRGTAQSVAATPPGESLPGTQAVVMGGPTP